MIFNKEYINKNEFHRYKKLIIINEVEIKRIVLNRKNSYDKRGAFKYFIGYISNTSIIPLYIKHTQMNTYTKYFDRNSKYMSSLVHDKEILKDTMKYGIILENHLKKNLIVKQCIMINTLKLK